MFTSWRRSLSCAGACSPDGFAIAINAPARVASSESATSLPVADDTTRMGRGDRVMICFVASRPSSSGMWTSIVIKSGISRSASSTASVPVRASPTTTMSRSADRMLTSSARAVAESSATSTRIMSALRVVRRAADESSRAAYPDRIRIWSRRHPRPPRDRAHAAQVGRARSRG